MLWIATPNVSLLEPLIKGKNYLRLHDDILPILDTKAKTRAHLFT